MQTIVGVFSEKGRAEQAVQALEREGFSEKDVSLVAKDAREGAQNQRAGSGQGGNQDFETGDLGGGTENVGSGTAWGSGLGAVGGLLASAGALAIPGIGPIVAAGPLAATLSGAVAGGVTGGLVDMGIPEQEGQRYEDEIKQGSILAVVETDQNQADSARRLLEENGAREVKDYPGRKQVAGGGESR